MAVLYKNIAWKYFFGRVVERDDILRAIDVMFYVGLFVPFAWLLAFFIQKTLGTLVFSVISFTFLFVAAKFKNRVFAIASFVMLLMQFLRKILLKHAIVSLIFWLFFLIVIFRLIILVYTFHRCDGSQKRVGVLRRITIVLFGVILGMSSWAFVLPLTDAVLMLSIRKAVDSGQYAKGLELSNGFADFNYKKSVYSIVFARKFNVAFKAVNHAGGYEIEPFVRECELIKNEIITKQNDVGIAKNLQKLRQLMDQDYFSKKEQHFSVDELSFLFNKWNDFVDSGISRDKYHGRSNEILNVYVNAVTTPLLLRAKITEQKMQREHKDTARLLEFNYDQKSNTMELVPYSGYAINFPFEVKYPGLWYMREEIIIAPSVFFTREPIKRIGDQYKVGVGIFYFIARKSFDWGEEKGIYEKDMSKNGMVIVNKKEIEISGQPALRLEISAQPAKIVAMLIKVGNNGVIRMILEAPPEEYAQYADVFENIIKSFKFTR